MDEGARRRMARRQTFTSAMAQYQRESSRRPGLGCGAVGLKGSAPGGVDASRWEGFRPAPLAGRNHTTMITQMAPNMDDRA
jgi:hypothetical protein